MGWYSRLGLLVLLVGLPTRCLLPQNAPLQPSPTAVTPNPVATPPAAPTRSIVPDSGWELLRPGLERRVINATGQEGELLESLYILRFDPQMFRFDVAYRPGEPLSLNQWQRETGALVVLNGGYFTESFQATGLIVINGQPSGTSYTDFGGMLAITAAGPELRWLPQRPYDPAEPLLAGLQSFPVLVQPGGQVGYEDGGGQPARRTVVAQDKSGRLLFIIAALGTSSLQQLSQRLLESDFELDMALNLDGGASTGLLLAEPSEGIIALSLLPSVITVYPR